MQDFSVFPTYDIVKNGIKSLSKYKWPTYDKKYNTDQFIKNITDKLFEHFNVLPDLLYIHDGVKPLSINLFRARSFGTFQDISLISEYKCKPIQLTTEIQRCNFPLKPIFYCSNDAGTAIMEVIRHQPIDTEKKYLISKWRIINDFNIKVVPFLYSDLPAQNYYKLLGVKALSRIPDIFEQKLTNSQIKGLKLYFNYLATIFTTENYSLSASIAHRILYANHNFRADLFLYPSVQTDQRSINIAIHPNFVDVNMQLVRIYSLQVNSINYSTGEFKVVIDKYAEIEENIIMWKPVMPDDEKYKESIKKDFGFGVEFNFSEKNMD